MADESGRRRWEGILRVLAEWQPAHRLETYLYRAFGLKDDEELQRLALFLLAHAALDRALGSRIADRLRSQDQSSRDGRVGRADGGPRTFGDHLSEANRLRLITPEQKRIASNFNKARNGYLHWRPSQTQFPQYGGESVTSKEGMRRWMADAVRFFDAFGE